MPRRVCVVTGTRAEYGLLRFLMRAVADDPRGELRTVVTGAHLVASLGDTWREIEQDGFVIDERAELDLDDTSPLGIARSLGLGVERIAGTLAALRPDVVVLLGDRYEVLAAAQAAMLLSIPVAHLHGGETTEGAFDESIRHAVTKLSHLHFVAADPYRRRVMQLGEDPAKVFTVGAFGLDALTDLDAAPVTELSEVVGLDLAARPFVVLTYHPVTLDPANVERAATAVLNALDAVDGISVLATMANADPGGQLVNALLEERAASHPDRFGLVPSLGHRRYLSALQQAAAVVGNSSSGIIEAPAVGVPTVNVGDRQAGRLRASSIVDVPEEAAPIAEAVRRAVVRAPGTRRPAAHRPYGSPGAAARTAEVLLTHPLDDLLRKRFHDLA